VPLSLRRGRVTAIRERHDAFVRLEVEGVACVAYPTVTGPVALEDEVLVNVQARELELGSGGFDIVYANLTRGLELAAEDGAHVMVLPYTPLQHARIHAEEAGETGDSLDGMPVVCCSLHSQVAPVCAALGGLRVAYVQLAGGALPVSLSDTVRALRERGLLAATAAVAPCFDGDAQCVSVGSALLWARGGHEVAVCSVGPGIVGTGTRLGHGGLAAAEAANATLALGGVSVVTARVSGADERERHRGVSHHTEAVLALVRGEAVVPSEQPGDWREACDGLPLSHMGRGPGEDPDFFAAAYAAGVAARGLVSGGPT
jgi:Protein of unknown function (DUF3866)